MTETAKRYGGSLYELAQDEGLAEELLAQLQVAEECLRQNPDYMRLLTATAVPQKERTVLLDQAFEGAHPYLVNFMKLLCDEGLMPEFHGCVQAYRTRYNRDRGIAEVVVTSAVPLTAENRQKLAERLTAITGKKITLKEKIDPSVLGGLRLDMDGVRLDGTVQRHLERLREEIDGATL